MPAPGTVVITGGTSGIGLCAAELFAAQGWRVGVIARGEAGLEAVERRLLEGGAVVAWVAADVVDGAGLERAAEALEARLGPVTVWVNCAGNGVYGRFMDVPEEEFRRVMDVTLMGTVNGTRAALRLMQGRDEGAIINVCSAIAFHAIPMLSSYAAAKMAVRGFTEAVRHELVQEGSRVRLTVIYPPAVNTPFFSHAVSHMPRPPRPAKPVYQPEIVADAILMAARSGRREVQVGGITVLFGLAVRVVPGLVDRAVQRLGSAGQMTDCPEAARLREPTLFAPSGRASGRHGTFCAESRRFSAQMWLSRRPGLAAALGAVLAAAVVAAWTLRP